MGRARALAVAIAVGVAALALGGFTLSFASLRDLAIASGVPVQLAFIWPLIVDGFIVVATAAAFELKGRRTVSWYPWSALVVFSAISVTGNALHATDSAAALRVPLSVASVVSSVPAIALLIASHLMVVMASPRPPRPATVTAVVAEQPSVGLVEAPRAVAHVAAHDAPRTTITSPPQAAGLVARLEEAVAGGNPVTGALIGELLGVSARTGRRRMDELRVTHPHLFPATDGSQR